MNKILVSFVSTLALLPFLSHSMGGGIVTDPKSYTYYVEQIKNAKDQLETAQDQLDSAKETVQGVLDIKKNVEGNLRRAQRSLAKISKLKDDFKENPDQFLALAKDAIEDGEDLGKYRDNVTDNLNDVFGLEGEDAIGGWGNVESERKKKASRQRAAKNAVIGAEVAKGMISNQMSDLESLALASNSADSLKDASDVSNAIYLKMVENQHEMIRLLADISQNISLAYYDGQENISENKASIVDGKDLLNIEDFEVKAKHKDQRDWVRECNPFAGECDSGDWE